jgi:hypothetical protein
LILKKYNTLANDFIAINQKKITLYKNDDEDKAISKSVPESR